MPLSQYANSIQPVLRLSTYFFKLFLLGVYLFACSYQMRCVVLPSVLDQGACAILGRTVFRTLAYSLLLLQEEFIADDFKALVAVC